MRHSQGDGILFNESQYATLKQMGALLIMEINITHSNNGYRLKLLVEGFL